MTFDARETSLRGGQPIRLYDFSRGQIHWRYCNADRDITDLTFLYRTSAISDDGIRLTGQSTADAFNITVPGDADVVKQFRGIPPSVEISVVVRDLHYGDTESIVAWIGSITSVGWPQPGQAIIACQSIGASFDRPGLSLTWDRSCPYAVFDSNCGLNRDLFKVVATLQSVSSITISSGTFATKPDGWFDGGYVEWDIGFGEQERRAIQSHAGSDCVMFGGTDGIANGITVSAYPGCRQDDDTCNDKFDNAINNGGNSAMPGSSPFDGERFF